MTVRQWRKCKPIRWLRENGHLFDWRTPEERRVAIVKFDPSFADWQRRMTPDPWKKLKEAVA